MGALNRISEMKKEGMAEDQIIQRLREEGVSPREIQDAFNQDQIRNAVTTESDGYGEMPHENRIDDGGSFYTPKTREVQEDYSPGYTEDYYAPEAPMEGETYSPQPEYGAEGYGQYEASNTDTMIEVAEQVFSEKIRKIEKKIDALSEFANLGGAKITNNHERIKRIESVMDKMQIAILEKIGSYGKNIEGIKKEMEMMEESFSKVLPELAKKHHKDKK